MGLNTYGNGSSSTFGIGTTNVGNALTIDSTGMISIGNLQTNNNSSVDKRVATLTSSVNNTFFLLLEDN